MKVKVVKDHFCGTGWRAEPETLYLGGVGAVYVEKLEFELPEEWDGLAVTLHIEQEGGAVPQPMLLDRNNNAPVDRRFTTARQGLWMLMATDGEGRREMTMLEAVKNTRESADSAAASAQKAQKMAEGEMQGTSLTGAEKKLLVQIRRM